MSHSTTIVLILLSVLLSVPAAARVGLAEWEVYTPGGHLISDTDSQDESITPCLRTDAPPEDAAVLVSRVKRWRYFADHVAIESEDGYFLLEEATGTVVRMRSDAELGKALANIGASRSGWLTPVDGWREAWFPFTMWRPCRFRLDGPDEAAALGYGPEQVEILERGSSVFPSESECREALSAEWMRLYRETTWGRQCRAWRAAGDLASTEQAWLDRFCEALGVP